jgi:hypothetical protein
MNIKNIATLVLILVTSIVNIHAMEVPHSNEAFSDNVLIKHRAMENTPEYIQHQAAKLNNEQYNNADTKCMLEFCKSELRNTRECQEWLRAVEKEVDLVETSPSLEKSYQAVTYSQKSMQLNKEKEASLTTNTSCSDIEQFSDELLWKIDKLCEAISNSKELHDYQQSNTFSSNTTIELIESPASQQLLNLIGRDRNILNRYKIVAATEVFQQYKEAKTNSMPERAINFCKKELYVIPEFKDFMHITQQKNSQKTPKFEIIEHNNQDLSSCCFEDLQKKIMKKLNLKELKIEFTSDKAQPHKKNDCIVNIPHK